MSALQKQKGPASAPTLPDRGSNPEQGKSNMKEHSTGVPGNPDLPSLSDAVDILNRAWSQVELINMAAEACTVTGEAGNAIAYGCISVQELLKQVKEHLKPHVQTLSKGGAA